ncbi:hypothetical protein B0H14DRAFT_3462110 [Mycena olivaceomarginata]|nr:hypothetical protein B0H14DRAFT_3462110 [Mycena olivaceomarginata]
MLAPPPPLRSLPAAPHARSLPPSCSSPPPPRSLPCCTPRSLPIDLVLVASRLHAHSLPPSCSSLLPSALTPRCPALAPRRPRACSRRPCARSRPPHGSSPAAFKLAPCRPTPSLPAAPMLAPCPMGARCWPPFAHFPLPLLHASFNHAPIARCSRALAAHRSTVPACFSHYVRFTVSFRTFGTYRPCTPIFTHM